MKDTECNICGSNDYTVVHQGLKDDGSINLDTKKVYASSSNIVGKQKIS